MNRTVSRLSVSQLSAAALVASVAPVALAGVYDPAAGQAGSLAIAHDDPAFTGWATSVVDFVRGPQNIANPTGGLATFGTANAGIGPAGTSTTTSIVSLGDGGTITLGFDNPIADGPGADFAVFENSFSDTFLELAFVEVSSNGTDFFRFAAVSDTQTDTQVGGFGSLDPTNLYNLAGKYRVGFGTGFDLAELAGVSALLDVNAITQVRIVDAIGSIDPAIGSTDSLGNLVNDPHSTPFASGGFDLDAVGVINSVANVPEPTGLLLAGLGCLALATRRRHA